MKRALVMGIVVLLVLFAGVTSAFAWANGGDDGSDSASGHRYGTHDWILDQAMRLAGTNASWIESDTARWATDDPDTKLRDTNNHFYDNTRKGQGAPQTVADLYDRIAVEYSNGQYEEASRDIGLLSHYYADICQPFHTLWYGDDDDEHLAYELTVDPFTDHIDENVDWIVPRERKAITDVRAMTISAALAARGDYYNLRAAYTPDYSATVPIGNFDTSATSVTGSITRARLSRAVNDLADIITAVPTGQGRAPRTRVSGMKISRRYVGTASKVTATANVTDYFTGQPIRGARVTFSLPFSSGTINTLAYSDSKGVVELSQTLPNEVLWYRIDVKATARTNDVVSSTSSWMLTTPKVGKFTSKVSSSKPKQKTKVTATTRLTDANGAPIANLPVKIYWRFKTKTYSYSAVTDANGYVKTARNIGKATTGYKVRVYATAECGGESKTSSSAYFKPVKPKPAKKAKKK